MHIVERRFQLWAGILLSLCLSLCLGGGAKAANEGPGSIIRVWPLEGGGPSGAGGTAFRILYRSTGLSGEPIEVSGAIFIPPGPVPPEAATLSPGRIRRAGWSRLARRL
jgi:hypothetical protein